MVKDPDIRREEIIAAARELFAERGVRGTTFQDVAERVGVTRGLVYHYAADMSTLVDQVLETCIAEFVTDLRTWDEAREVGNIDQAVIDCIGLFRRHVPTRRGTAEPGPTPSGTTAESGPTPSGTIAGRRAAGQLRPRLGRQGRVLTPHVPAPGAPVAAHRDFQHRGTPPQRLVRQPAGHRVPRCALTAAPPAPLVRVDHPAGQDRPIRLQPLPNHLQAELVQACERGQVRATEGSVKHVEVFPMGSVRTPIIGRPRPLPPHRRAHPTTPSSAKSP